MESLHFDRIVVGAGISGIVAAATAAGRGLKVGLVATGPGQFVFGAGCVESRPLAPGEASDMLARAVAFFLDLTERAGYPFRGGLDERRPLPTVMGSFQAVALAPFSLWSGDSGQPVRAAVVGVAGLSAFDASFTAERLNHHARRAALDGSYFARTIVLPGARETAAITTLGLANRFDRDGAFRDELCEALRPVAAEAGLIILPGMLGLRSTLPDIRAFERRLGCPLCELPTLPPSVPGLRLFNALEAHLRAIGVEVMSGFPVKSLEIVNGRALGVVLESAGRPRRLAADAVILAGGPLSAPLLGAPFCGVDGRLRPITEAGGPIADNLYAAGALLHAAGTRGGNERAILTGYRAGMAPGAEGGRDAAE